MGSTAYSGMKSISEDAYAELYSKRSASHGVKAFTHTSDIDRGVKAAEVHERVDPAKIKDSVTGKRESRDSDSAQNSNAIAVFFDVTGSMRKIPMVLQEKLAKLMQTLLTKGVIDDPQVLFGAIGDATCDRVPFQVGQFESDLAMDEDLDKFFLEGGGGGQNTESYELGLFFLARLTSIDCYEKRGKRGYAFLIGDETAYPKVKRQEVVRHFGADLGLQEDIPLEQIVKEAQEKYEIFFIVPTTASWGTRNKPFWNDLFGQNVLELDNPDLVCETIVTAIGMAEGVIEGADDVAESLEMDGDAVDSVTKALATYTGGKSAALATVAGGDLSPSGGEDGLDL